jgi:hypothetical protein
MNLAPLDSSRQAALSQKEAFEGSHGVKFIAVACLIYRKLTPLKKNRWIPPVSFERISQKFLFEKKLFDERNPTV